jgi:hypothetical protein
MPAIIYGSGSVEQAPWLTNMYIYVEVDKLAIGAKVCALAIMKLLGHT